MNKSLSISITESRLLLQNPYAYLGDSGGYSALPLQKEAELHEITKSRQLQENPYAHLNEVGGFSALKNYHHFKNSKKKRRYSFIEIEQQARNLQMRMWEERSQLWPDAAPSNPIAILDPFLVLKLIGYDCGLEETLGQYHSDGNLIEVAGTIDNYSKQVRISRQFPNNIRTFTAAHELGHALLHERSGLHRDRPLDGASASRNSVELEADKFATFFLMPSKLVQTIFKRYFLTDTYSLNEASAFALGFGNYEMLRDKCKTLRQLSRLLVSAEQYNGLHFISLANQFGVSTEAMAIRLEELELLAI